MHRNVRGFRGFTLIELLVVISIIALLVGILLPALGAARKSAQRIKSLSNVRQIGTAVYGYAADNKDVWIPFKTSFNNILFLIAANPAFAAPNYNPGSGPGYWWSSLLVSGGYAASPEVFVCPSLESDRLFFLEEDVTSPDFFRGHAAPIWGDVHYGYNALFLGGSMGLDQAMSPTLARGIGVNPNYISASALKPLPVDAVKSTSDTIAFADSKNFAAELGGGSNYGNLFPWIKGQIGGVSYLFAADDPITSQTGFADARHQNSLNVFWADGHGANVTVTDTDHPYAHTELTNVRTGTADQLRNNKWDLN